MAGPRRENLDGVSRRIRRVTGLAALAVAALALSACQPRLGAAAVIGSQRITDDQLQTLVHTALAAPGVREALPNSSYKGDLAQYRRFVLGVEVERVLAETAANRLGITVGDSAVSERYQVYQQSSGSAAQFAAELASKNAVSPALFRELVRNELIESEVGYLVGGAKRPTEAQLRSLYKQYVTTAATATLSLVQLPDQATAQAAAARVHQDPTAFAAVAKQYAALQQGTSSDPRPYPLSGLPPDLVPQLDKLKSGDVFPYAASANGGTAYYLIKFGGLTRPTFESSRGQLQNQSVHDAAVAGQKYISTLAKQVGVLINPRYGAWDNTQMMITDFINPVVKTTPPAVPSGTPAAPAEPNPSGG